MLNFPNSPLTKKITQLLSRGPMSISDVIKNINSHGYKATIQGIYKALRYLKSNGIVLTQKKQAMINQAWLSQLNRFVSVSEYSYRHPMSDTGNFLQMEDGDQISYSFKNPLLVDIFWNHVLYVLFDALKEEKRWFAYSSHCWFLLARRKDELELKQHMNSKGIMYIFTVANKTALDKYIKKDFDGINAKYHMLDKSIFPKKANKEGVVLNVFGDYIIEAQYDKKTSDKIENFYKKYSTINEDVINILEDIVSSPAKIKFSISRDKNRAKKLQEIFAKNFYFSTQS